MSLDAKTLLTYCAINGYMPYLGSQRKRDLLPQEEQLKRIELAKQKKARKAFRELSSSTPGS